MPSTWKCTLCDQGKRYKKDDLIDHIDQEHRDSIPEGWTAGRVAFKMIHNKSQGTCVVCKGPTEWNEKRCKYQRLCSNPACRKKLREVALKNHIRVYGKPTLLTDMQHQDKMLKGRRISGEYIFPDGYKIGYVGSFEKNFLEFMDQVLHCKGQDIQEPGPILDYIYKGAKHQWITDFYYIPYNLVIEIKDGGDNPNKKAMPDSRERQVYKEKMITELGTMNYLRLTNNNFAQLLDIFAELKMQMIDDSNENRKVIIHINEETTLLESLDITMIKKVEHFVNSKYKDMPDFKKFIANLSSLCKKLGIAVGPYVGLYIDIHYVASIKYMIQLILTSLEIPTTLIAAGMNWMFNVLKNKKPKENILPFKTNHIPKDYSMLCINTHWINSLGLGGVIGAAKTSVLFNARYGIDAIRQYFFDDLWTFYKSGALVVLTDQWYGLDFWVVPNNIKRTVDLFTTRTGDKLGLETDIVVLITSNMKLRDNELLRGFINFYLGAAGNHIVIMHSPGSYSLYAHLQTDSIKVKPGQIVRQGEVIAKMGNTGNSSGPHLHFQMSYLVPKNQLQGMWFGKPLTDFRFSGKCEELRNMFGDDGDENLKKFIQSKPKQYHHASLPFFGFLKET